MAGSIPQAGVPANAVNPGPPQGPHRGNPGIIGGAMGLVGSLLRLPVNILQTSVGLLGGIISYGLGYASGLLPRGVRGGCKVCGLVCSLICSVA